MTTKVVEVIMCVGYKYSTREQEIDQIKQSISNRLRNHTSEYDFSNCIYTMILNDDNNSVLRNPDNWDNSDYYIRKYLQSYNGLIFKTQSKTFAIELGKIVSI